MTQPQVQVHKSHCTWYILYLISTISYTADYVSLMSSEVTFPQTAVTGSTQCVGVTLVDDSIVENTEQFSAHVTSTSEITLIASPSTATYSIVDDVDSKSTTLGNHFYSPLLSHFSILL